MRLKYDTDYDLRELQLRLVPLVDAIHKVCEEHGLRYFLWAGSMLGAVRHKGFIPWDDDMDIAMPLPDYEKLIEHCSEWLPAPFEIIAPENRRDYPYRFAKIIDASTTVLERPDFLFAEGVYVDIFPLYGMTDDEQQLRSHLKSFKRARKLQFLRGRDPYKHGGGIKSWLPRLFKKAVSMEWCQRNIRNVMCRYDYDSSNRVIDYDFESRGIIPKEWIEKSNLYEFEGHYFRGIAEYDKFLTYLYGDYMTLPPEDKRVQHRFYYLSLDIPYREFVASGEIEKYRLPR